MAEFLEVEAASLVWTAETATVNPSCIGKGLLTCRRGKNLDRCSFS